MNDTASSVDDDDDGDDDVNDDAHPKIDADFAFVGVIKDCSAIRHHPLWLKKSQEQNIKIDLSMMRQNK